MKVITIKQPFASLIVEGYKDYEFRSWSTKHRGQLLIHAGKSVDKEAMKRFEKYHFNYPVGCIIAKVELVDCLKVDDDFRQLLKCKNEEVYAGIIQDKNWEGYAFQLKNIVKIEPIQVKGQLGLWEYEMKEGKFEDEKE